MKEKKNVSSFYIVKNNNKKYNVVSHYSIASKKKKKKNVTLINAQLGIYLLLTHCVLKFFFFIIRFIA